MGEKYKVAVKKFAYNYPRIGSNIIINNYFANGESAKFKVISEPNENNGIALLCQTTKDYQKGIPYSGTKTEFSNGEEYNNFANSNIDNWLNTTYYNYLSDRIKNALVDTQVVQKLYKFKLDSPSSDIDPNSTFNIQLVDGGQGPGSAGKYENYYYIGYNPTNIVRKIALPSVEDCINTIGLNENDTLSSFELAKMFEIYPKNSTGSGITYPANVWTLDACYNYTGESHKNNNLLKVWRGGYASYTHDAWFWWIGNNVSVVDDNPYVRVMPKLFIDLRKLDWYYTD